MTDSNGIEIKVGDKVTHRFRNYPIKEGIIEKISDGCNAVAWVDFGDTVLGKKHLTITIKSDLIKV